MQIQHDKEQLKSKEADLKKNESNFADDKKQLDNMERDIQKFEVGIGSVFYSWILNIWISSK